jgi:NDP-sugar pyrophosphorylase family protein
MLPIAILAGGLATRLGSISKKQPKSLFEINARPFVDWQLELLIKNGYTDFVFCLSHLADQIQSYLGDGSKRGVNIQYSLDGKEQLGTGGAIAKALPLLGESFAVIYGDSYLPIRFNEVEEFFISKKLDALMTVYANKGKFDSSNVKFEQGTILEYKKGGDEAYFQHIDYGLSYFNSGVFRDIPPEEKLDLAEIYRNLVDRKNLGGFEVSERFYEIGSISGINQLSIYLERLKDEL